MYIVTLFVYSRTSCCLCVQLATASICYIISLLRSGPHTLVSISLSCSTVRHSVPCSPKKAVKPITATVGFGLLPSKLLYDQVVYRRQHVMIVFGK